MGNSQEEERRPLSSKEYDAIGAALFEMINAYHSLPAGVKLDYQSLEGINHIGFFTAPDGKYLFESVTGGFEAQISFDIMYKCSATNNSQRLGAEEFLNDIADYLSEKPYPALTGGRIIEKITMNSTTYRSKAEGDGSVTYVRSGSLKYEKD